MTNQSIQAPPPSCRELPHAASSQLNDILIKRVESDLAFNELYLIRCLSPDRVYTFAVLLAATSSALTT